MAVSSVAAPSQYRQPSRKGKKAWRKNIDITEIQEGLENVREEVIKGGIVSELPSEELFAIDTSGSKEIQKSYSKKHKMLKSDEILAQRSAVTAVDSRKRSNTRVTNGIVDKVVKRRKGNGVKNEKFLALREFAYKGDAVYKDVVKADGDAHHDPWAVETTETDSEWNEKYNFLEPAKAFVAPKTLTHAPVSLTADGKPAPATRVPESGKSYNPDFEAWVSVMKAESEKEVEAEKKRIADEEEERRKQELIEKAQQEESEASAQESAWEGIESEYEEEPLPVKRPQRKTPQERKRAQKRKEEERKAKWEAQMKKKEQQAQQAKQIAKELKEKEQKKLEQQLELVKKDDDSALERGDETALRRERLGKYRVPEATLELVLPDELEESLRRLKPEGNLLRDRYRNMLIRGKMETRKPIWQHKKANREVTEKWWSKDFKI